MEHGRASSRVPGAHEGTPDAKPRHRRRGCTKAGFAAVGRLAVSLSPDDLAATIGPALDVLCRAAGAMEMRLFLRLPPDGESVLAARAASGRPISKWRIATTRHPLPGSGVSRPTKALGHVEVDWPGDRGREDGQMLVERALRPVGAAVRAGLAAHREVAEEVLGGGVDLDARRRLLLDAVLRASGAGRATLVVSADEGSEPVVISTAPRPSLCSHALHDGRFRCSLLAGGRPRAATAPRSDWPSPCRALDAGTASPTCLPLRSGDELRGALILDYGARPPSPIGRDLVPLMTMARVVEGHLARQRPGSHPLEIRCLGPLEVRLAGRLLPPERFRRRKALELLKVLILANGRPVAREELARLLWPDATPSSNGRQPCRLQNRLHGVVHALRAAIEPRHGSREWNYVLQREDRYVFDSRSPHWTDLAAFARHEAEAAVAEERDDLGLAIGHLDSALRLYRGDLFADAPPADWFEPERTELRRRCLAVVSRLAELKVRDGDPDGAVTCLRRGLHFDPLREDLHQVLIQTLAESGRRDEARAQYHECARVLRDELDLEPLPATQRLRRLIGS